MLRLHRTASIPPIIWLAACGAVAEAPAVDVSGVWHGTWQGEGAAEHGFAIIELRQEADGALAGGIYLRYDLPSLVNIGTDVIGRVAGRTITFQMQDDENPHRFEGEVAGESASGSIAYRGQSGSWQATRLPSKTLAVERSFDAAPLRLPRAMTKAGAELWATDAAALYRVDLAAGQVRAVSPPSPPPSASCQSGLAFDGQSLLCTGGSPRIDRIDFSWHDLGSFELDDKAWPAQLAFDGKDLWVAHDMDWTIRRADLSGHVLATVTVKASVSDLTWGGDHLYLMPTTPNVVLKVDRGGQLVAGYQLPRDVIVRTEKEAAFAGGIAFDSGRLWVVVQRMPVSDTSASRSSLHALRLD